MTDILSEILGGQDLARNFFTTPFADYTVTEGLLLALLLCVVAAAVIKLLKEGFYWLW